MHQYITVMKEHEFVLWVIGAHACDRGKFVYELPDNVVEVHEVFLDDALKLKEHGNQNGQLHRINHFSEEETRSLRELMECSHPDWEVLFHLYHDRKMNPMSFLKSEQFLNILTESCLEKYPYIAFADAFHTMRSMLLPVLYLLGSEVPQADTYHAISTGYLHLKIMAYSESSISPRMITLRTHRSSPFRVIRHSKDNSVSSPFSLSAI